MSFRTCNTSISEIAQEQCPSNDRLRVATWQVSVHEPLLQSPQVMDELPINAILATDPPFCHPESATFKSKAPSVLVKLR
jgi:hypothetical protein